MGAWGVKIFQSDVALDVKEEFKAELLLGKSDEEALKSVLELCRDFVNDMDYDSLEFVIKQLLEYKLPEKDAKLWEKFEKAFKNFDWDEMEKLLNN